MKFPKFLIAFVILSLSFTQFVNAQFNSSGDHSTIVIIDDVMEIMPNLSTDGLEVIEVTKPSGTVVYMSDNPNSSGEIIDLSQTNSVIFHVAVLTESGVIDAHTINIE
jgi:hypothetical protein